MFIIVDLHKFMFNSYCVLYVLSGAVSSEQEIHMEGLRFGLNMKAKVIIESFASLQMMTQQYLQENYTTENLVTCILDVRHVKSFSTHSPLKEVIPATSVGKVFSLLKTRKITTYLKYSLTKRIICTLCRESEELQERIEAYEEEVRQYTQVRLVDISDDDLDELCSANPVGKVQLLIKTDEFSKLEAVLDIEEAITNAFHCEHYVLHLKKIEPQNCTLHYMMSVQIAKSVFPLTNEEWVSLTHHGVVELKCLHFEYSIQENGI